LAKHDPQGRKMLVAVIAGSSWPIPWYLRDFPQVDWFGREFGQPVFVYPSDMREQVVQMMIQLPPYSLVSPEIQDGPELRDYWELRPNVRVDVQINRDLLKEYKASRAGNAE
jgi:hypothetical protein